MTKITKSSSRVCNEYILQQQLLPRQLGFFLKWFGTLAMCLWHRLERQLRTLKKLHHLQRPDETRGHSIEISQPLEGHNLGLSLFCAWATKSPSLIVFIAFGSDLLFIGFS